MNRGRASWWIGAGGLAIVSGCGGGGNDAAAAREPVQAAAPTTPAAPQPPGDAEVGAVETAGLLPPRSIILDQPPEGDGIAFAFRTPDAPDRVIAWYRAPGERGFALQSELSEGAERVLSGETRRPAGDFSVRLAPDERGGTTAMVLVVPRR